MNQAFRSASETAPVSSWDVYGRDNAAGARAVEAGGADLVSGLERISGIQRVKR